MTDFGATVLQHGGAAVSHEAADGRWRDRTAQKEAISRSHLYCSNDRPPVGKSMPSAVFLHVLQTAFSSSLVDIYIPGVALD